MKFLLDDNVPYSLKIFLTGKNIECVKTFEVSLKSRDDEETVRPRVLLPEKKESKKGLNSARIF